MTPTRTSAAPPDDPSIAYTESVAEPAIGNRLFGSGIAPGFPAPGTAPDGSSVASILPLCASNMASWPSDKDANAADCEAPFAVFFARPRCQGNDGQMPARGSLPFAYCLNDLEAV